MAPTNTPPTRTTLPPTPSGTEARAGDGDLMGMDSAIVERATGPLRASLNGRGVVRGAEALAPPRVALFLRWARWSDMTVALTALVGAFLLTNVGRMPYGFGEFLAVRVTVKN